MTKSWCRSSTGEGSGPASSEAGNLSRRREAGNAISDRAGARFSCQAGAGTECGMGCWVQDQVNISSSLCTKFNQCFSLTEITYLLT